MTGRRTVTVDPARARAYAAATNDANPCYADGRYAPPVFGVVPTWDVLLAALGEVVPADQLPMLLHAEHDMRWLRPLVPGMRLSTFGEPDTVRVTRMGTWVTLRLESTAEGEEGGTGEDTVLVQYATMFVRGMTGGEDSGPDRPAHAMPAGARDRVVVEQVRHVDADQTYRYRDASGDTNPIHVDDAFARSVGLPGIILHGLCTMAMCGAVVVDTMCEGDPSRLARLAVRFSKPVLPGDDLHVTVYPGLPAEAGECVAFEAAVDGKLVVRDGLADVRAA